MIKTNSRVFGFSERWKTIPLCASLAADRVTKEDALETYRHKIDRSRVKNAEVRTRFTGRNGFRPNSIKQDGE